MKSFIQLIKFQVDREKFFFFFGYLLLAVLAIHTWDSADTFMHLNYGRLAWEQGSAVPISPFIMQHPDAVFYWLFRFILLGVYRIGGVAAVSLGFGLVWAVLWDMLFRSNGFYRTQAAGLLWFVVALITINSRMTPRPEVLSFMFLAGYLVLITSWQNSTSTPEEFFFKSKEFWLRAIAVVILQFLWVGIHGYFIFGPILLAIAGVCDLIDEKLPSRAKPTSASPQRGLNRQKQKELSKAIAIQPTPNHHKCNYFFALATVALLASVISPRGPLTLVSAYRHAFLLVDLKEFISEFDTALKWDLIAQIWTLPIFWLFWLASAVIIVFLVFKNRRIRFAYAVGGLGLMLSFTAARSMPFLPILTFLAWAELLTSSNIAGRPKKPVFDVMSVLMTFLLCVSVVTGWFYTSQMSRKSWGFGLSPIAHAVSLADYFSRNPFDGLIFNPPEDGGYLQFNVPRLKLYGDTQFTQVQATKDYVMAVSPEGFDRLNQRNHFDAAILQVTSSIHLMNQLLDSKDWTLVFGDLYRVVLVRNSSKFASQLPYQDPVWFTNDAKDDLSTINAAYPAALWAALISQKMQWTMMDKFLESLDGKDDVPSSALLSAGQMAVKVQSRDMVSHIARLAMRRKSYSKDEERKVQLMLQSFP